MWTCCVASYALPRPCAPNQTCTTAHTQIAPAQTAREVVESVERLDGALKRREPAAAVQPLIDKLVGKLQEVGTAVARIDEVR